MSGRPKEVFARDGVMNARSRDDDFDVLRYVKADVVLTRSVNEMRNVSTLGALRNADGAKDSCIIAPRLRSL